MSGANHQRVLPHLTQADLDKIVDEFGRVHWFMRDGRRVCGRLKRVHNRAIEDEACLGPPMQNGACKVHGGKAGPPMKHGRYSRVLTTWQDSFERARADKDLVDSRRDIALMDTLIEQLLARAEDLDTPSWRAEVKATFDELQDAIRKKRSAAIPVLLKQLGTMVDAGAALDQVVGDVLSHVDKRAGRAVKAAELELKREEKITVSELALLFTQWLDVVREELGEEAYFKVVPALRRITVSRGISQLGDEDREVNGASDASSDAASDAHAAVEEEDALEADDASSDADVAGDDEHTGDGDDA